jgi:hypothetical protein
LTRRIAKITVLCVLSCVALCAIVAGALFWRLSQGPVSLASVTPGIEEGVNKRLSGLKLDLGEAFLELDPGTYVPTVRFRNVTLMDGERKLIASAPKAAVTLDRTAILSGEIVPVDLELIGPSVKGRRNLDGGFELGIVGEALPTDQTVEVTDFETGDDAGTPKSDLGGSGPTADGRSAPNIIPQLVKLFDQGNSSSLSTLKDIRISKARVTLYDEANDSTWFAPQTELTFRRMPYGFVMLATADVASISEPWRAEVSATYRRAEKKFEINARVANIVPAHVAQQIYAFSQFAKARFPLSGDVEIEMDDSGKVLSSKTVLLAGAGTVSFPEYFSQTIAIDEGKLAFNYDPASGNYVFGDSYLGVNGQKSDLTGQVRPLWSSDGRIEAYEVIMSAANPAGTKRNEFGEELNIDGVDFAGTVFVDDQRLQIDDLLVRAGQTGVRIKGEIVAGTETAGFKLAGRLKDVSAPFLKRMWPPIMAPNTRTWINSNILSGRISDGTFHVNLPVDGVAQALRDKRMPPNSVNVQFSLKDVRTKYFRGLPPLEKAVGRFKLIDNTFDMTVDSAVTTLPDGQTMALAGGTFVATDVLADEVAGAFNFDVNSSISALDTFSKLPDISGYIKTGGSLPSIRGMASVKVGLQLPLIKNVPRDKVRVTTAVALSQVAMDNVVAGVDLTDGQFSVAFAERSVEVKGPAKINGMDAKIVWRKPGANAAPVTGVETVLDSRMRQKLGIKLDQFLEGPIPVKIALQQGEGRTSADVELDLSRVSFNVPSLGWKRAATKGTRASFSVQQDAKGSRVLKDVSLRGQGIGLSGDLSLGPNGDLRVARLRNVEFGADIYRSVIVESGADALSVTLEGTEFDARPYIGRLSQPAESGAAQRNSGLRLAVDATFDRVIAFRGETMRNVRARFSLNSGRMTSLKLDANHATGQPIKVQVTPKANGREMKVTSGDGGATLRAANYYSKVAGGRLEFFAQIADLPGSPIRNGELEIRDFGVRDEAALAQLDKRSRPKKAAQRRSGLSFSRLTIPFRTDQQYVYLPDIELKGNELGAVAKGDIRKSNGALRITGTMIPAQGISNVIDDIPIFGQILTGGKNEGVFGVTFALGGTMKSPKYQVNPLSAIAPGIFRKLFEFQLPKKKAPQTPY